MKVSILRKGSNLPLFGSVGVSAYLYSFLCICTLYSPMISIDKPASPKMKSTKPTSHILIVSHCSSSCLTFVHLIVTLCSGNVDPNSLKKCVLLPYRMPLSAKNYQFSVTNIRLPIN